MFERQNISPFRALQTGMECSRPCMVGLADGEVICAFGVVPLPGPSSLDVWGAVWFMAAEDAFGKHGRAILRRSAAWVEALDYDVLWNISRSDIPELAFWLGWLGFDAVSHFTTHGFPMAKYRREQE